MNFLIELDSLDASDDFGGAMVLAAMVETLADTNVLYLRANSRTPKLYDSKVCYALTDAWRDIPASLRAGFADCKSLAPWRIAELRVEGKNARPRVLVHRDTNGGRLYHIQVDVEGTIEDPSKIVPPQLHPSTTVTRTARR